MARQQISPEKLREIREFAALWGKIVAQRVFGQQGPGLDVDFNTMEEVAQAASSGLTEGTLSTLLEQQAQSVGAEQPCPDCGRRCPVKRKERTLTCRGGTLTQSEPLCHCPDCRRDFFPPTTLPPPRQSRL